MTFDNDNVFGAKVNVFENQAVDAGPKTTRSDGFSRGDAFGLLFNNFLGEVSVTGLKYTVRGDSGFLRRLIWFALVAFGLGFMTYQIRDRVAYFQINPSNVHLNVETMPALQFPTLTFCNENILRLSRVLAHGGMGSVSVVAMLYPSLGPMLESTLPIDWEDVPDSIIYGTDWKQYYKDYGNDLKKALKTCRWKGVVCNYNNFTSVMTDMYHCFTFNPKGEYKLDRTGAKNGLQLILDVEQHEYIAVSSTSISAGYLVLLHDANEVPRMSDMAFKVSPGTHTLVAMSVTKRTSLASPYGTCTDASSSSNRLERYEVYSLSACKAECEANYIEKVCNCTQLHIPVRRNSMNATERACNPKDLNVCVFEAQQEYVQNNEEVKCTCPQPCQTTTFEPIISSSILSEYMKNTLQTYMHIPANYSEKNFVKIDFFFKEISYLKIEEKPAYTVLALFCDIGGALGLILGSTLLTVCEIIDFIFVAASAVMMQRRGKKANQVNHSKIVQVKTVAE